LNTNANTAYISFLTLPTYTYFSSTSFTITFWIRVITLPALAVVGPPAVAAKQARVIDFSDATTKANGITVFIKAATTNAAITLESKAAATQTVSDTGAGFAVNTWKYVAITVSTSGATITTAIYYDGATTGVTLSSATGITALPAASTSYTTNFIGKGTSPTADDQHLDAHLNDVKIFNSALSPTQVTTQYNSEKCNFYFKLIKFNLF
jgi:hypothetical protein